MEKLNNGDSAKDLCEFGSLVAAVVSFHLLATQGSVESHQNQVWHMNLLVRIRAYDPRLLLATDFKQGAMTAPDEERAVIDWWKSRTAQGGEGMVVAPLEFAIRGKLGQVHPAVMCRGRQYGWIIHGPDYDAKEDLCWLRNR